MKKTILLTILDGFGWIKNNDGNSINNSKLINFRKIFNNEPFITINASSTYVGLPKGQMGNSEVGHINIGTGRVGLQSIELINNSIKSGKFYTNNTLIKNLKQLEKSNGSLNIMGLLSKGGIHSHEEHIFAILKAASKFNFKKYLHIITDGRDTTKNIAKSDVEEFLEKIKQSQMKNIYVASISGRYFAMDRDKRWERIDKALAGLYADKDNAKSFNNVIDYISTSYKNNEYDEFIQPAYNKSIDYKIAKNDLIIMCNFRQDRAIQITSCLSNENYIHKCPYSIEGIKLLSMRKYADSVIGDIMFPLTVYKNTLGEFLSEKNYSQLRIAETEKYAHVTFFFDGGKNIKIKNSDRILIDSPKVKTYDLCPEMSAYKITEKVCSNIGKYDVIILNFANADMVGHTGNYAKSIEAINVLDKCIGNIYAKINKISGTLIITADHGNAETMFTKDGDINKKHSVSPIPLCIINKDFEFKNEYLNSTVGSLCDIAPTILKILGEKQPSEMTGKVLIKRK